MQVLLTGHNGALCDLYLAAFRSFRRHNPSARIVCFSNFSPSERSLLAPLAVELPNADVERFKQVGCGFYLEPAFQELLQDGDEVISCDLDLLFGADPFVVFRTPFDVFYTTRHYNYHYVVNGGVRGFRVNDHSRAFISFHSRQIACPTWPSYIEFIAQSGQSEVFLRDQHLFCTLHLSLGSLPDELSDLVFYNAGPRMNYCPDFDWRGHSALLDLLHAMRRQDAVIYHLKGQMKEAISAAEALAVLDGGGVPVRFYRRFLLEKISRIRRRVLQASVSMFRPQRGHWF